MAILALTDQTWPPRLRLRVYDTGMGLLAESRDRHYALSDSLWRLWKSNRTLLLGISTDSAKWSVWDECTLELIESKIRKDLAFDGCGVDVSRHTRPGGHSCEEEFVWKLQLRYF